MIQSWPVTQTVIIEDTVGALRMVNQIDSGNYTFEAASAWLIEHGFELNNREWASLIWLGILAVWLLSRAQVRHCLEIVIRSTLSSKLLIIWVSFIMWIAIIVLIAQWQRLWDLRLTKDTVVWVATAGVVLLAGFTDAHKQGFFCAPYGRPQESRPSWSIL